MPPVLLGVSGMGSPTVARPGASIAGLTDAQLVDSTLATGTMPAEIAAHPELLELVLPTLRNDLTIVNDHVHRDDEPLSVPAGLPPIRLHDLRHGAATLALASGSDLKVVQHMLRHSSIAITADTYTSVLPQVARDAAEAAATLVRGTRPTTSAEQSAPTLHPHGPISASASGRKNEKDQVNQGGPRGTRTHNLRIKSPQLCRLS